MADEGDELLLGSDTILTQPVTGNPVPPRADAGGANRTWLAPTGGNGEAEAEAPRGGARPAREGGTLFERMSHIARGAAKAQVDEEPEAGRSRDPLDIPRFLNRQNNQ